MEDDGPPGVPEWVVTYGDMMSLLLTFFIMLVSMSELKGDGSMRAMLDSIKEAFGPTVGRFGVPGESLQTNGMYVKPSSSGRQMAGKTEIGSLPDADKGRAGANKSAKTINHGKTVTLGGPASFGEFDWHLNDRIKADLDTILVELKTQKKKIMLRGHASPRPLPKGKSIEHPLFPIQNRWDLSFARALAVSDYLIKVGGIPKERIIVSAVGDTEPHTITGKKRMKGEKDPQRVNRRVDVFLIDSYIKHKESQN